MHALAFSLEKDNGISSCDGQTELRYRLVKSNMNYRPLRKVNAPLKLVTVSSAKALKAGSVMTGRYCQ